MGEFGRTPRMNAEGGRDHWGNAFSVLMGCGWMKMGQAIGKSNPRGELRRGPTHHPAGRGGDDLPSSRHRIAQGGVSRHAGAAVPLIETGGPIRELLRS